MGKRGPNTFRRNDAIRAIESAQTAGVEPAMVEVVVTKDGSVAYRIYSEDVVPAPMSAEPGAATRLPIDRPARSPRKQGQM
jgi:hypothetical protein